MSRYDRQERVPGWDQSILHSARVSVVGAGATGTIVALRLTEVGVGTIRIYDEDVIEETNLHRQHLYWTLPEGGSTIGEPKAKVLAERLSTGNPLIRVRGYVRKIDSENIQALSQSNVLFDCGDNFQLSYLLDNYADESMIPLVSGHTGPFSGYVSTFLPGKSVCLNCQHVLEEKVLREGLTRNSCVRQVEPTTPLANAVIGSLMAAEGVAIISPVRGLDPLKNRIINYDLKTPGKMYSSLINKNPKCEKKNCEGWKDA